MPRPMIVACATLLLLTGTAFPPPASGGDILWPAWRGPQRDGWAGDFQPPDEWPRRLARVWRVEVGAGYASPIVAGDDIYQFTRQGEEEVVWCGNLETGAVKWQKSYAAPFTIGGGGERHGKGPKSSPAWADGRLFTFGISGILSAWDADSGELIWRRDYSQQFETGHPFWGAATSPLVDENRVVVHFGTDGNGALIALDVTNGEKIWRHGDDAPSYASPILVDVDGQRQIVELNQRALLSVDAATGRLLWEYPYPQVNTDQNMVTPVFHQGILLVGGENRGILGLRPRHENDAWTVEEIWHQKKVALDMSSAVVNGHLLYGFSHYGQGRLFCLDIHSGEVLWQGPPRAGENVALLAVPGYVVALINDGELKVIRAAGDRFEEVVAYRVADGPTWAPPVLLEDGILVKDQETLTRWSLTSETAPGDSPIR